MSITLLQETLDVLNMHDKTPKDVLWVGARDIYTDWKNFSEISNIEYDAGYGSNEIAEDLVIVGDNWWLSREEYDGSEWWRFNSIPKFPLEKITLKTVCVNETTERYCTNLKEMQGLLK